MRTITRAPEQTMAGPYVLTQGGVGAVARMPIFLPFPNGTDADTVYASPAFGFVPTPPAPFDCPPGVCANATHYLWGMSTVIIDWPLLLELSRLHELEDVKG